MENNLTLIFKAIHFAADKHRGQSRKDENNTPYINHPIALANLLTNQAGISDVNVIAAAILHDTVEDTDATVDDIEDLFGRTVRDIVIEVTDDKSLPSPERKRLQIEHAGKLSHEAKLVKLADKISNLQDIITSPPVRWSLERKREYFDWAKAVIDQLRGTNEKLEALFDKVYQQKP
ncbi:MAG: phosphohydrolase [Gammaproteobacteria bacterium RIFCSPLOWO2_02_FULL_47_50]|jgi:guanosine-3',5'-bis(diphosphate) 3'-pyrophosphohydrolase|nr:MAG: phosphohydrolase [Gammaproteobacteria bacterium RIFCSPLOWO2_01_FULL_47_190]OGT73865.1 MAG: phosphohydrolase [Gammaproteobacteria bacterium RIFCSPLOWO2_12_47_11]OGT80967.1 MAG: phosphohydrolase [Gammaproteobacteria bacterium RIFCSPLOWO2_02_FULL_47_50]OGT84871.1 MAG: phosphohydrolase [Gammaproteobacteria bacterium RIFCSPLOWO2_12_FULL_47_76]